MLNTDIVLLFNYIFLFQWDRLDNLYKIVLVAIYVVYLIIECMRLYIGYVGNLMERVITSSSTFLIRMIFVCKYLAYFQYFDYLRATKATVP